MTPEPLTKEIVKEWKKLIWDDKYPELWDVFEDYIDIGILDEVKKVIRKRVQRILKEIEKETNKYLDTYSHPDDEALRRILEAFSISITEKIKKAFEEVLKE